MPKLLLIISAVFVVALKSRATLLVLDSSNLTQAQIRATESFLAAAESKLPPVFKGALAPQVRIQFKSLNPGLTLRTPRCESAETEKHSRKYIYGEVVKFWGQNLSDLHDIHLDLGLLEWITLGSERAITFPCQHKNTYRLAEGVLLHELAHLFDYRNLKFGNERKFQKFCAMVAATPLNPSMESCHELQKYSRSVSDHPAFLNLVGWTKKGLLFKNRTENLNHRLGRSPDLYEYKNAEEAFAVNFEFFILDEDYSCRRPSLARFFTTLLQHRPFTDKSCKSSKQVQLQSRFLASNLFKYVDLEETRLYQIDYLFAAEGDETMSRWGHSMYRLVFCRPGRALGPDCRLDLAYHIVVSFRAEVTTLKIDPIAGLEGNYDVKLYLLGLQDVIEEYSKKELRPLYSLPLKINGSQKKAFLNRVKEQYWTYRGSYRFLTNNCATEALGLLQSAFFSKPFNELTVTSPLGLLDLLAEKGFVQRKLLNDQKNAINQSYLIPSVSEKLLNSLSKLNPYKKRASESLEDLKRFVSQEDFSERQEILAQILSATSKNGSIDNDARKSALASLYALEDYGVALRHLELLAEIIDDIYEVIGNDPVKMQKHPLATKIDEYKNFFSHWGAEQKVTSGYGVPLDGELDLPDAGVQEKKNAQLEKLVVEFKTLMESSYQSEIKELKRENSQKAQTLRELIKSSKH